MFSKADVEIHPRIEVSPQKSATLINPGLYFAEICGGPRRNNLSPGWLILSLLVSSLAHEIRVQRLFSRAITSYFSRHFQTSTDASGWSLISLDLIYERNAEAVVEAVP